MIEWILYLFIDYIILNYFLIKHPTAQPFSKKLNAIHRETIFLRDEMLNLQEQSLRFQKQIKELEKMEVK